MPIRSLWFGPRGFERWIKMPKPNMDRGQYGWSGKSSHLGGGATTARSAAGHMEYPMEWGGKFTIEEARTLRDVLDGTYDTDDNRGLLYFNMPDAGPVNQFSKLWAAPYLCGLDAPSLTKGVRPTLAATAANAFDLPARSAAFAVTAETSPLKFHATIPPDHSARFAFYGPAAQAGVITATPYTAGVAGTPVTYGSVANASYGTGFTTLSGIDGIEFSLTVAAATVTLTTAILQIYPTGSAPATPTAYLSGVGHSGCHVDGNPDEVLRSTGIDRSTLGVNLIERGSWL